MLLGGDGADVVECGRCRYGWVKTVPILSGGGGAKGDKNKQTDHFYNPLLCVSFHLPYIIVCDFYCALRHCVRLLLCLTSLWATFCRLVLILFVRFFRPSL